MLCLGPSNVGQSSSDETWSGETVVWSPAPNRMIVVGEWLVVLAKHTTCGNTAAFMKQQLLEHLQYSL